MTFVSSSQLEAVFQGYVYIENENKILIPDGRLMSRQQINIHFGGFTFCVNHENTKHTTHAWDAFLFNTKVRLPRVAQAPGTETLQDARRAGKMTYSTGKPCRRGHVGGRYVSTGNCVECMRENAQDKAVIQQSVKRMQRGKKLGNPQMFAATLPLDHHARFKQLQMAYLYGDADWVQDLDAALQAMLSTAFNPADGKPFDTPTI
jgi:hypothetical protein